MVDTHKHIASLCALLIHRHRLLLPHGSPHTHTRPSVAAPSHTAIASLPLPHPHRSLVPPSPPIQSLKDLQVFTGRVIFQLAEDIPCISAVVVALLSEVCSLSWRRLYWTWILWFPRKVTSSPTYFQNFVFLSGWNCKLLHMKTKASHSSLP
ncbi:unnamed protein product [Camellia sinensis]